jgi:multiple sugar transport system substrate-binding protein
MFASRHGLLAAGVALSLGLAACGGSNQTTAVSAKGAIKIWYSNNAEEVKWGDAVVAAWNANHSDQKVTAEQIPAGKTSEAVIGAAITAGTTPCLIFNTAPAAVPQFQ